MHDHPQTIVVGIDRSPTSLLALEYALRYLETGASVHCIQVLEADEIGLGPEQQERNPPCEHEDLSQFLSDFGTDPNLVEEHVVTGKPGYEICSLAEKVDADLVIVGTHGRRGLSQLWLGSCSEAVVRGASCPVLVVRPKLVPGSTRPRPANTSPPSRVGE